jgi:predicted AlkP superfamily pyrophosphatase or phosphodiesterase
MPSGSTSALKKKVLILGIDGCRPDAIPAALDAHNMHQLVAHGAFSSHCDILGDRPTKAFTITGPGWSTILTGVWSDKHGVTDNAFHDHHLEAFPSIFSRFKQARPDRTAIAFVTWQPFVDDIILAKNGAQLVVDGDKVGYEEGDRQVTKAVVQCLAANDPDLVFAYFGSMDSAGHGYGFHPKSPKYTKALEVIDEQIGRILAALQKRPTYAQEDWLIIACTDHGGRGREHGFGKDVPEIRNGLLLLDGPAVDRAAMPVKTGNVDVAVTALTHLGIPIQPEWKLDGHAVGLKAVP